MPIRVDVAQTPLSLGLPRKPTVGNAATALRMPTIPEETPLGVLKRLYDAESRGKVQEERLEILVARSESRATAIDSKLDSISEVLKLLVSKNPELASAVYQADVASPLPATGAVSSPVPSSAAGTGQ
jgi:hypothetical protein